MSREIRIGTRKSLLALAQTVLVAKEMEQRFPDVTTTLVKKQTVGDQILDRPLLSFGGKGVFISEFEEGLLAGTMDFAVHSAKDLPTQLADGLAIVGVPKREDPRDVLVTMTGMRLQEKKEVVIGTSSLRRKLQISQLGGSMWPDSQISCKDLRGNVQTRLSKLEAGEYHGILLAAAGLKRLGLHLAPQYEFHYFDCDEFIPAAGQGILAIEGRVDDEICQIADQLNHEPTLQSLQIERYVLKQLDAGCHEPVGVYSEISDNYVTIWGICQRHGQVNRICLRGEWNQWQALAIQMAGVLDGGV